MMPVSELKHLSYSSVALYLDCPQAWYRRYVLKEQVPKAPALVFGGAFHKALETLVRGAYHQPGVMDPFAVFVKCWHKEIDGQNVDWQGESPDDLADAGTSMICHPDTLVILGELMPLVDEQGPVVERFVTLRVPEVPIPIIGYVDLVTSEGIPLDFKTTGRMWTQEQAQKELQPAFYLAALDRMGLGRNIDKVFIHFVISKPSKRGGGIKAQTFRSQRTDADFSRLFSTIAGVWKGIEAGAFPHNTGGWKCDKRWCDYWSHCMVGQ